MMGQKERKKKKIKEMTDEIKNSTDDLSQFWWGLCFTLSVLSFFTAFTPTKMA